MKTFITFNQLTRANIPVPCTIMTRDLICIRGIPPGSVAAGSGANTLVKTMHDEYFAAEAPHVILSLLGDAQTP